MFLNSDSFNVEKIGGGCAWTTSPPALVGKSSKLKLYAADECVNCDTTKTASLAVDDGCAYSSHATHITTSNPRKDSGADSDSTDKWSYVVTKKTDRIDAS